VGEILVQIITSKDLDVIVSWDETSTFAVSSPTDAANTSIIYVNEANNYFKSSKTFSFRVLKFLLPGKIGFFSFSFFFFFFLFILIDESIKSLFTVQTGANFTINTCSFEPRDDEVISLCDYTVVNLEGCLC
jgi:hypothetical protein